MRSPVLGTGSVGDPADPACDAVAVGEAVPAGGGGGVAADRDGQATLQSPQSLTDRRRPNSSLSWRCLIPEEAKHHQHRCRRRVTIGNHDGPPMGRPGARGCLISMTDFAPLSMLSASMGNPPALTTAATPLTRQIDRYLLQRQRQATLTPNSIRNPGLDAPKGAMSGHTYRLA